MRRPQVGGRQGAVRGRLADQDLLRDYLSVAMLLSRAEPAGTARRHQRLILISYLCAGPGYGAVLRVLHRDVGTRMPGQ